MHIPSVKDDDSYNLERVLILDLVLVEEEAVAGQVWISCLCVGISVGLHLKWLGLEVDVLL